jgi:endonuclease G
MNDLLSLIDNAEKRYYNRDVNVEGVLNKIRSRSLTDLNPEPVIEKRVNYINYKFDDAGDITKERIIGNTDFLHINYFEKGLKAAKTVGRIVLKNQLGNLQGYGTGFLVSPRLLITNCHVLKDKALAAFSEVEFNYEYDSSGRVKPYSVFRFEPEALFTVSPPDELDYALIAVCEMDIDGKSALGDFGFMPLIEDAYKVVVGESLTIIQHPRGEFKQVAVRENKLIDMDNRYLRYQTDTAPGSSGSMVVNDQWEVVALHHSGVPRKDGEGNILTRDNKIWDQRTMKEEDIDWIANEGVRISEIVKDIKRKQANDQIEGNTQLILI